MSLEFKKIEASDIDKLTPYFNLRPNKTCDSVFLESYLWRNFYQTRFAISDEKSILWLMTKDGEDYSAMPMCKEEDLEHYFTEIKNYFNQTLKKPLKIYLADEAAVQVLKLPEDQFEVEEMEDDRDYIYDSVAMKTLSGKKLHKKKNHLNGFLRQYEGRYLYRTLCCSDRGDIWRFLDRWRLQKSGDPDSQLDMEVEGIHEILKNCSSLGVHMGGVFIDGDLQAFSIGSCNCLENMVIIHIEKANSEINGLYQFINQQFLINEFPDAKLVNREDDMGIEGLRRAKMSYDPIDFARKYMIRQKNFK